MRGATNFRMGSSQRAHCIYLLGNDHRAHSAEIAETTRPVTIKAHSTGRALAPAKSKPGSRVDRSLHMTQGSGTFA